MSSSAQFLLTHFDRLAEAPGGIAKLRALIRQLAVEGKLVEQSSSDKPVRLVAPLIEDNQPFNVPESWCWIGLSGAAKFNMGKTPSTKNASFWDVGGIPWVSIRDIEQYGSIAQTAKRVSTKAAREVFRCPPVSAGTLVMSFKLSIGKVGFLTVPAYHNEAIISIYPIPEVSKEYLFHFLPVLAPLAASKGAIKGSTLNRESLSALPIPVPPLAEQRRIVAKVEELMGLCDALEAAQREREATRTRLRTSALHQLASPDSDSKSAAFVLRNLHSLATAPEDFSDIREAVLELAALGRLTRQLHADGLASDLLRRIGNPSAKKRKPVEDEADESEPPPEIPSSWIWTTVGALAAHDEYAITDGPFGANLKTDHYIEQPGHRVIRLQNIGRGYFKEEHRSYLTKEHFERLAKHHIYAGDLVVAGLVDPFVRCCEVPDGLGPMLVKADCYRFKVHLSLSSRFILHYLNSAVCQRFAAVHHHGMTLVRIGLGNFRNIPVPLPPLAEQRRIVAKVDELMAVLDALEATLTTARTTAERLLAATIARLHAA